MIRVGLYFLLQPLYNLRVRQDPTGLCVPNLAIMKPGEKLSGTNALAYSRAAMQRVWGSSLGSILLTVLKLKTFCSSKKEPIRFSFRTIEIGLEQAPFVVFYFIFSTFEHVKSLLIIGPNNT